MDVKPWQNGQKLCQFQSMNSFVTVGSDHSLIENLHMLKQCCVRTWSPVRKKMASCMQDPESVWYIAP